MPKRERIVSIVIQYPPDPHWKDETRFDGPFTLDAIQNLYDTQALYNEASRVVIMAGDEMVMDLSLAEPVGS